MSFHTYEAFEASLKAARARRRIPNVNKTVLRKVIQSTESHNRNQEEQDMWTRHFASKKKKEFDDKSSSDVSEDGRAKKKKKKKKKRRKRDSLSTDGEITATSTSKTKPNSNKCNNDPEFGPSLNGFLEVKNLKWGHDGFHELYDNGKNESDNSEKKPVKKSKKKKKRKKEKYNEYDSDSNFKRKRRKKHKE